MRLCPDECAGVSAAGPPYDALVLEHFERPRNAGRHAPGPQVISAAAGQTAQGTRFVLSGRIEAQRLAELRFEAYGCPHSIAAASWLTQRLQGASRAELRAWDWREVAAALNVPAEKRGRLLVLEDAVRALERAWPEASLAAAAHGAPEEVPKRTPDQA